MASVQSIITVEVLRRKWQTFIKLTIKFSYNTGRPKSSGTDAQLVALMQAAGQEFVVEDTVFVSKLILAAKDSQQL